MKIAYIARLDGADLRVALTCNSLASFGHDVVFLGWDREPGKSKQLLLSAAVRQRTYRKAGVYGGSGAQGLNGFRKHVWGVLREERPDVVHVVNEDGALLVLLLKHRDFQKLVLDVFDSVTANRRGGRLRQALMGGVRMVANQSADRIIETWESLAELLGRHQRKSVIIANCAPDPGDEWSRQYPEGEAVLVSVGGTLLKTRDQLDVLLAAAERCPPGSVRIMGSGFLRDDYARDVFSKHPLVTYRWLERPVDFLREAAATDAVLYLRGDAGESEYRARVTPNRLFDAMAIGRPLIVNSDLRIATWVEQNGLGFAWPNGDVAALSRLILSLRHRRTDLPNYAAKVRRQYLQGYTWSVMEQRLHALYKELEREL